LIILIDNKEDEAIDTSMENVSSEKEQPPIKKQPIFNFYVYGGNYPEIIIEALKTRGNWQETKDT